MWYDVGSISVTNGSTTVTGTGTDFISGVQVGEGLYIGGDLYEIATIVSGTQLTLADAYLGSTATGQDYKIIPTQSLVADLSSGVADLISDFADVRDYAGNGKFNDGSEASPAITFTQDQNNGLYRIGSDNWGLVAGGDKQLEIKTTGVKLDDNKKVTFGAGDDLQIYHDGNDSYIDDAGQGSLAIRGSASVSLQNYSGGVMVKGNAGGSVDVYHNNSKKLATTSTGVDVTGTVSADDLTVTKGSDSTAVDIRTAYGTTGEKYSSLRWTNTSFAGGNSEIRNVVNGASSVGSSLEFHTEQTGTGGLTERLKLHNNGDVSFYEDTGTTAKMVWDASAESLGIGTSSPTSFLDVRASGTSIPSTISLVGTNSLGSDSCISQIKSLESSAGSGSSELSFHTRAVGGAFATPTERMRIDSAGNVGIGTGAPDAALSISGNSYVNIDVSDAQYPYIGSIGSSGDDCIFGSWGDVIINSNFNGTTSQNILFKDNTSERARIDSSGNLLVGATDVDLGYTDGDTGFVAGADGMVQMSRNSANATLHINKLNNDGNLIQFNKDGSAVGSIGSVSGNYLDIKGGAGIVYIGGNQGGGLRAINSSGSGQPRLDTRDDATTNLGATTNRFKDLYLSGGVYFGGTGADNKLDDYEEGVFTPSYGGLGITVTHDSQVGQYVKVGRAVHFTIFLGTDDVSGGSSSENLRINGLPFTPDANSSSGTLGFCYNTDLDISNARWTTSTGSSLTLYENSSTLGFENIHTDALQSGGNKNRMYVSGTYFTNA